MYCCLHQQLLFAVFWLMGESYWKQIKSDHVYYHFLHKKLFILKIFQFLIYPQKNRWNTVTEHIKWMWKVSMIWKCFLTKQRKGFLAVLWKEQQPSLTWLGSLLVQLKKRKEKNWKISIRYPITYPNLQRMRFLSIFCLS